MSIAYPPPQGSPVALGDATPADVLSPATFSTPTLTGAAGTMPNQGAPTFNPSTANQPIAAGYYSGGTVAAVTGSATVADVLTGATFASAAGIGLAGTMPNNGAPTLQPGAAIAAGYYSGGGAASVKVAVGSATPSTSTATFYEVGGTANSSFYPLTIPVPSGAATIIAAWGIDGGTGTMYVTATPKGYADGVNAASLVTNGATSGAGTWQSGGALELGVAGIVVPISKSAVTLTYTVIYT